MLRPDATLFPPVLVPPSIFNAPSIAPFPVTPSPDAIQGLGQTLFGCSPQNYNNLPVDQRVRCPPLFGGAPRQEEPIVLKPLPEAKDEAFWQEQWREDHLTPGLCVGPGVLDCIIEQKHKEDALVQTARDAIAAQKAAEISAHAQPLDEKLLAPHR